MVTTGAGGFTGAAPAEGPRAGYDKVMPQHPLSRWISAVTKKKKKKKKTPKNCGCGQDPCITYGKNIQEGKKKFTPHKMIDKKNGKEYWADTYEKHLKYDKMGYVHEEKNIKSPWITYLTRGKKGRKK